MEKVKISELNSDTLCIDEDNNLEKVQTIRDELSVGNTNFFRAWYIAKNKDIVWNETILYSFIEELLPFYDSSIAHKTIDSLKKTGDISVIQGIILKNMPDFYFGAIPIDIDTKCR